MKMLLLTVLLAVSSSTVLLAQIADHIPPCGNATGRHSETTHNCHGYAQARAFGKTWNATTCPASTLFLDEPTIGYFEKLSWNPGNVQARDIISWGRAHSAYVTSSGNGTVAQIMVDQVIILAVMSRKT